MWRNSRNIILKAPSSIGRRILQQPNRCSSGASTSGGGAAKAFLWTTGALVAGAGGTVGYAWYDPEFRRTIEKNVPQAKDAFQKVLGEPRDASKPMIDFQNVKQLGDKISSTASSIIPARKEQKETPPTSPQPSASPKSTQSASPTPSLQKDTAAAEKRFKEEETAVQSAKQFNDKVTSAPATVIPIRKQEKETLPALTPPPDSASSKSTQSSSPTPLLQKDDAPIALQEAKDEFEEELRKQMLRQTAAHSQHLEEALTAQKAQLESQHRRELDEALIKERDLFNREIATSIARLQAIENALEGRAEQDNENRRAKELWLACQHLKKSVLNGRAEGRDYDSRKKPLVKEVTAIKEAGSTDPFVKTLLSTINKDAVTEGVFTQDDLVDRFQRVKKVCRRTALIDDNGGTLFQYFLGLVQSVFLLDRVKPGAKHLQEVDPAKIDTVGILWRASSLVEQLDFESAIKLMLLLKGEPARLASDWINDARLHLETRRTAELLLAHASAVSMRTIY